MKKEIIINYTKREVRIAILEDRQLVEFLIEREDSRRSVGDIFIGTVNAVLPGIQAAFVDIGQEKAAFLHVSDVATDSLDPEILDELDIDTGGGRRRREYPPIESLLSKGQTIIVQVRKEAIGTKGPRVSSQLSLPGRYAVFMPNLDHVGVSKKIDRRKERSRLRSIVRRIKPRGGAVIVRTAGEGVEEEPLREDIRNLEKRWTEISRKIEKATPPSIVHEDVDITVFALRDLLTEDVSQIVIDRKQEYERIRDYVGSFAPELLPRVRFYRGKEPIFDHYDIEDDIEKTLERKIWLRKGAYIVIEHTEALVSIDVNTGRFTGKRSQEETILEANLIAAREIARQLRLRDIGGIIVVDFIDMEKDENKRKVYNEFRKTLRKDRSRARVSQVSDLGLIEVSRKRVRPSLMHFYSDDCPYCSGSGKVLSIESMAMKMEHWIRRIGMSRKEKAVRLTVNPVLGIFLREERWENITELAGRYRLDVEIIDDPRLHREDFDIRSLESNRDLKRAFS